MIFNEDNTPALATAKPAPFWKIWANPIFRRYCRSRLRVRGLGFMLLVSLILAAFLFFIFRVSGLHRVNMDVIDAERLPIFPLLFVQGLLLFILGTGQVAGGMTAEADEGVIDYQRLSPMTPLAKVMGYLFGLPVREYVCCFATMPFTLWAFWCGEVDWRVAVSLYAVFFSSTILYHLTGLVAGTVLKNRRWAFLVSMGLVFLLYTVMPQISNFGLAYFRYLTIWPVLEESVAHLIPRNEGAVLLAGQAILGTTRFFDIDLPEVVFTLISQTVVILTLIMMVWRRWRRADSHLLGKAWAAGLYAWIQVTLLGNALPRIESGMLFPSREFARRFGNMRLLQKKDWAPEPVEAVAMAAAVGLASLGILWVITSMITPNAETQLRGWRRARKLGRKSLVPVSDPATAFWWVAIMTVCGASGWIYFTQAVIGSRWFPGAEVTPLTMGAFGLVFFTGGLGFHALLESKGARVTGLCAILLGLVPVLVGAVLGTITNRFAPPAVWIAAISPLSGPVYAATSLLILEDVPLEVARAMPRAFWFCQGVAALGTLSLVAGLRKARKEIARSV